MLPPHGSVHLCWCLCGCLPIQTTLLSTPPAPQAVKPQSQRNVALYEEITAAMGALKTQLSAVA